ncbi:hypothetical protein ABZ721_31425 [Streptomyces sp. NPDC006733]|uniref:hypothetical protein n=1 Tax=Streptomyces sp. NPDC006733 TaxID=3155460 RepID=UPI0033DFA145
MSEHQPLYGWTLRQIRNISHDARAQVLSPERAAMYTARDTIYEILHPVCVLGFSDLCLVQDRASDDWHMGSLQTDGSITCWSTYPNLDQALRGL